MTPEVSVQISVIGSQLFSFLLAEAIANQNVRSALETLSQSGFTQNQAVELLAILVGNRRFASPEEHRGTIITTIRQINGVSRAILRTGIFTPADIQQHADAWIRVLNDDRQTMSVRRRRGDTAISVSEDLQWWPASYLSWCLAGSTRLATLAFDWANAMRAAGLAKHSAEKYLTELLGEEERQTHRQLITARGVKDEDLVQPSEFMAAIRDLSVTQRDRAVLAVLQGEASSITMWWRTNRMKQPEPPRPRYEHQPKVQAPTSPKVPAKAPAPPKAVRPPPDPLTVGPLIHRLQLKAGERPMRRDLIEIAETLWRNRYVGGRPVSRDSLKNLLRARSSDISTASLETRLACLERLDVIDCKCGIALRPNPSSIAGRRIMRKLAARFPR